MRLLIALLLWLVGAGIMIYGIGSALLELVSLYQGALTDPLNQPEGAEKGISDRMVRNLIIGAAGIPFIIVGTFLVRSAAGARRRRMREARLARKRSS